jgi:hypothetical protein
MPTYRDLAMLARIYARQAHVVTTRKIAAELWRRASQYQAEAAKLDNGRLPILASRRTAFGPDCDHDSLALISGCLTRTRARGFFDERCLKP